MRTCEILVQGPVLGHHLRHAERCPSSILGYTPDCVMITFVIIVIARGQPGCFCSRGWLGFAGIILVSAAGLAAYGFNSALGECRQGICHQCCWPQQDAYA